MGQWKMFMITTRKNLVYVPSSYKFFQFQGKIQFNDSKKKNNIYYIFK